MNIAQMVHHFLGVAVGTHGGIAHGNKNASHRKAGPGRYHFAGDGSRTAKQKSAGAYGRGLRNWLKTRPLPRI